MFTIWHKSVVISKHENTHNKENSDCKVVNLSLKRCIQAKYSAVPSVITAAVGQLLPTKKFFLIAPDTFWITFKAIRLRRMEMLVQKTES